MCGVCAHIIANYIYCNNLKIVADCRICEMFRQRCEPTCIHFINNSGLLANNRFGIAGKKRKSHVEYENDE